MVKKGTIQQKYSLEFKIQLVERYLAGESGGLKRLSRENGLKSDRQLRNWIKKHQAGELTADNVLKRTGSTGYIIGRPRTQYTGVEDELACLKLENEYLKKSFWHKDNQRSSLPVLDLSFYYDVFSFLST